MKYLVLRQSHLLRSVTKFGIYRGVFFLFFFPSLALYSVEKKTDSKRTLIISILNSKAIYYIYTHTQYTIRDVFIKRNFRVKTISNYFITVARRLFRGWVDMRATRISVIYIYKKKKTDIVSFLYATRVCVCKAVRYGCTLVYHYTASRLITVAIAGYIVHVVRDAIHVCLIQLHRSGTSR